MDCQKEGAPIGGAVLLSMLAGICSAGLGGALGVALGGRSHERPIKLFGFTAGIMLVIVLFEMLPDALRLSSPALTCVGVLSGSAAVWLLSLATPRLSAARRVSAKRRGMMTAGMLLSVSIAAHNLPEGLVIGTEMHLEGGLLMALLIALHDLPEGMAMALPLREAGASAGRIVLLCMLSGLPTVAGAMLGYLLGTVSDRMIAFCLALAGGAMMCVVCAELLPRAYELAPEKRVDGVFGLLAGVAAGLLLVLLL